MPARLFTLLAIFLLSAFSASAQITKIDDTTSTPVPGAGHDYIHLLAETVNPANGSVSIKISVPMPKGRGISIPFAIAYDSNGLSHLIPGPSTNPALAAWVSNKDSFASGGWSYVYPSLRLDNWTDHNYVLTGNNNGIPIYTDYPCGEWSNYLFSDGSGGIHSLGLGAQNAGVPPPGGCPSAPTGTGGDADYFAKLVPIGTTNFQSLPVTVFDKAGTTYYFSSLPGNFSQSTTFSGVPSYIEDSNGNKINATQNGNTSFSFTDTLGRTVISANGFGPTGTTNTVSAGGLNYTVTWKTVTGSYSLPNTAIVNTLSNCDFPSTVFSYVVVSQIGLPNGQSYNFYYGNDNPNGITNPYGLLSEIDYPDGGAVRYTWKLSDTMNQLAVWPGSEPNGAGGDSPVTDGCIYQYKTPVIASRQVFYGGSSTAAQAQSFIYSTVWNSSNNRWTTKTTQVTTSDNVRTLSALTAYTYTFYIQPPQPFQWSNYPAQTPLEQTTSYYDWGNTTAPLRTVNKTWANPFDLASQQTVLRDVTPNLTSQTSYTYGTATGTTLTQLQELDEYDFGASSPTRKTVTAYQSFSGTPGIIARRPCKVQIQNGSGTTIAETDYYYDGTNSLCSAISSGVAVGGTGGFSNHDETLFGTGATTPRGNATKIVKKCLQTCTDATTTNTFDVAGNVLTEKDPCGNAACSDMTGMNHTTTYSYTDKFDSNPSTSTNAYVTKITDALGHISNFKYAYSDGQLIQSWGQNDPNATGLGTRYLYGDSLRRLTETDYLDGGKTTLSYSDTAPSPSVTTSRLVATSPSSLSVSTTSVMDGMGHVTQTQLTTDPDGATYTDVTYDGFGRVRTQSNPHRSTSASTDGVTTNYYDGLGRPCLFVPPDGTLPSGTGCPSSQPNNTILTTYSGNTTTVTDQAGKARKSVLDGLGRLTTVFEDPASLNYETDYTYNLLDDLLTVNQRGGSSNSSLWRTRTFTYNSLSRLTQAINPESGTLSYAYDANGNLQTKTSPKPNQTSTATVLATYTYDALNRLTQKSFNDGSTPTITYGYDGVALAGCATAPPTLTDSNPIGSRTAMCDGAGAESWSHDSMGRVLTDSRTTNALTATYPYTYNLDGSIKTVGYGKPGSTIETITYNQGGAGRYLSETTTFSGLTYVSAAHYAPNGALCGLSYYGNNAAQNVSFNNRFQPLHWHVTSTPWGGNPAPPPCQPPAWTAGWIDRTYNYMDASGHNNGNVVKITNNASHYWSQNFTYDGLNRIATAQTDGTITNGAGNCWAESYNIDAWGNLLSNAPNPTTQSAYTGCIQEASSNLTGILQPSNRLNGMGYTTDAAGNVIADAVHTFTFDAENHLLSTAQTNQTTVAYKYDGDGKRVQKSSGTIYWYGRSSQPLVETNLTGATLNAYYYFNGRLTNRRPWTHVFNLDTYVLDALGNTDLVSGLNTAGSSAWDYSDYYPYGGEWAHQSAIGNHYKFTGKERDPESGLDDFSARFYGSSLGRFTSPDKIFVDQDSDSPQSWNLYSYAANNPITNTDPDGLACVQGKDGKFADDNSGGQSCADINREDEKPNPSAIVTARAPKPVLPPLDSSNTDTLTFLRCSQCDWNLGGLVVISAVPKPDNNPLHQRIYGESPFFPGEFNLAERELIAELEAMGYEVKPIARAAGRKTADVTLNGVETELKILTQSGGTTIKNAIERANEQTFGTILVDARKTTLSAADALSQIERAQGNIGGLEGRVIVFTREGVVRY